MTEFHSSLITVFQHHDLEVRKRRPLVHCVTNQVVMNFTANVLYAAGASPLMSQAPEEGAELAALRSSLLINIGTLTQDWVLDVEKLLEQEKDFLESNHHPRRAILDPVGAGASKFRTETALKFLGTGVFAFLRGNAFEIQSLIGEKAQGRGVDSLSPVEQAHHAATILARDYNLIVAVSGPEDYVTDGRRSLILRNGSPLLSHVTGTGCSLNALIAAWTGLPTTSLPMAPSLGAAASTINSHLWSVAGAITLLNLAAEKAEEKMLATAGPGAIGCFAVELLNALAASLDWKRARIEIAALTPQNLPESRPM